MPLITTLAFSLPSLCLCYSPLFFLLSPTSSRMRSCLPSISAFSRTHLYSPCSMPMLLFGLYNLLCHTSPSAYNFSHHIPSAFTPSHLYPAMPYHHTCTLLLPAFSYLFTTSAAFYLFSPSFLLLPCVYTYTHPMPLSATGKRQEKAKRR